MTVAPESQSSELFDHLVSSFQGADVAVSGNSIVGTLKFIEGGLAASGPLAGDGHFLALKFTNIDADATSVLVGLDPSQGTGLVELINDPDKNGVFKIHDNNQVFKVVQKNATAEKVQIFSLANLVLEEAQGEG